ncbi:MAG: insulinase family protein [Clostridia bacterium]|nr:insulinase family protein [Clostridia bacterium]
METGKTYSGFYLKRIEDVPEALGTFHEFEHIKTGLKLAWFKTEDTNKTFSITFKTVPEDSTGVFHILEHSCLQGSEKYPLKAPFVELIKNSLNTFLNAMTFPDKTMYPVSSRDQKDFENLVSVYMDAVFNPLLHENENIFLQEGWHYEYEDDAPKYNGVVLNEMRGATSSVDSMMMDALTEVLYDGTCYMYSSGGNPKNIPDLTYEKFKETHKRFYHPSNAYIILDGDLASSIERLLQFFDSEYLSKYEKKDNDFEITYVDGKGHIEETREYAVQDEDDESCYLIQGYCDRDCTDLKRAFSTQIWIEYLTGSNASPLTHEILKAGLAEDVVGGYMDGMLQPFAFIKVRNMKKENRAEVEKKIREVIEKTRKAPLDREQLEAIITQYEFASKERDYGGEPVGLVNSMIIMESWLYDMDPVARLVSDCYFKGMREEIADGTFAKYLDIFLENEHTASVLMTPSATYLKDLEEAEKKRLEDFNMSLSEDERNALKEKQNNLKNWQSVPNTPEELKVLPTLKLSEIGLDPMKVNTEILDDFTIYHREATKGIKYLRLFTPITEFSDSDIPILSFTASLFGDLRLKDTDRFTLEMLQRRTFGYNTVAFNIYQKIGEYDKAYIQSVCDFSYLKEKEDEAVSLMKKIITETDFTDIETIKELLDQQKEVCEQSKIKSGHRLALTRARASVSEKERLSELSNGITFCDWVSDAVKLAEENPEKLISDFERARDMLFGEINNMKVSLTSDEDGNGYTEKMKEIFRSEKKNVEIKEEERITYKEYEFVPIPAKVSFAAAATSMKFTNAKNSGAWLVYSKLASMDYLWNRVRVQGGAYGTGMSAGIDGTVAFYSYRDPEPDNSLKVFKEVPGYIREFAETDPDLTGIIIGTISDTEPLTTPYSAGKMGDAWYFMGLTDEMRKERRKDILSTSKEDLLRISDDLEKLSEKMYQVIVGQKK